MAIATYGNNKVSMKSSVYDRLLLVGADETPLMTLIGSSSISAPTHSWITDAIAAPKHNAQLEISDYGDAAVGTKQKTSNHAQIFTSKIEVSRSMQKARHYGGNEVAHQMGKIAKEHKNDIEFALLGLGRDADNKVSVFKAPTIRDAATPGEMAGIFHYVSKAAADFVDGRRGNVFAFDASKNWKGAASAFTIDKLHQVLQSIWEKGGTPRDVLIGAELKKAINAFATRQFGNEKAVNNKVVSLETDFGTVNFRLHRYLSAAYGLGDCFIAGDFSYAKNGLYIPTEVKELPATKTAIVKAYYTECALEVRNADAFAIGVGLKA